VHRVSLLELLGGIGLVIGDVLAVGSVVGSALLLMGTLINLRVHRRVIRLPDQIFMWSFGGLGLGVIVVGPWLLTGTKVTQVGLILGLSQSATVMLLLLSGLLLAARSYLRRRTWRA
jgi:hypothetical protein